jgi:hypothetical protein
VPIIIKGYRAIVPAPPGKGKPTILSRIYLVKTAAEMYVALAIKSGHPTATLETVHGFDNAGEP